MFIKCKSECTNFHPQNFSVTFHGLKNKILTLHYVTKALHPLCSPQHLPPHVWHPGRSSDSPSQSCLGALPLLVSEPGLCFEMHPLVLEGLVQTIPPLKAVSSVCPPMKNETLPHGTLLHFCHLYFVLCSGHSSTHKSL